jgi:hypothetical protein
VQCGAHELDGKTGAAGNTYRGEAAQLMVEAARREQQPVTATTATRAVKPDLPRPLPYAEPKAINDNAVLADREMPAEVERPPASPLRVFARILMLPLYLAGLAISLGLIGLFVKSLFGL